MPQHKGAIRKSFGDVLLALLYFAVVTFVGLRIFIWGIRKFYSVLTCVLCCRCCKSRKGGSSKNKRQKASNVATATERGKAAVKQPPAKEQTKAKGKK
eukprot:5499325-Amphidinium_carterae.1